MITTTIYYPNFNFAHAFLLSTPPLAISRPPQPWAPAFPPPKHVPCGKRADFGYDKDFDKRYSLGKLLGHGQFGYTYVGIDKASGDRVAVKRLEKSK
ncbi:Protein kinase domain, partial [Sesbania bispinosa]